MTSAPLFTVVIPTYNQADYLGIALDSLLAQTESNWEAVVVNDGSTDGTRSVIEDYCAREDRIRGFHKPNGGVGSALNRGLAEARGEWVCWLSSDDLFEPDKLQIHRDAIARSPSCRFFFTHFRYLNDETGETTDPPLWHDVPERRWQILGILLGSYVHGNSICVHRESWRGVGDFDESLRHGQDYDMWLRLLAQLRAEFLPERTCVTRWHEAQTTHSFPEMGFFDSSRAAIRFINQHAFPELVPEVDLSDPAAASEAVERALEVAGTTSSQFLYGLGPHLALVMRVLEWVWSVEDGPLADAVRDRARAALRQLPEDGDFGFLCRAARVALGSPRPAFDYSEVDPLVVAQQRYWRLEAQGDERAVPLRRYLKRFEPLRLPDRDALEFVPESEVVFVNQWGLFLDRSTAYGSQRAMFEVAKHMQRTGRHVLVVSLAQTSLGFFEGIPFVGARTEEELRGVLKRIGKLDVLVALSRTDVLPYARARRSIIYNHGSHAIQGSRTPDSNYRFIRAARVPVICVSDFSAREQITYGTLPELTTFVPNGFDHEVFSAAADGERAAHSLVFAGHLVSYKGLDIGLRAFELLKQHFPDATLSVYGGAFHNRNESSSPRSWHETGEHLLAPEWLDGNGLLLWSAIERDLPGLEFHGEVGGRELAQAFGRHSLLIVPARNPETFGLVSLEAQACGCMPVLPRHGGFPETVDEAAQTGVLYEPNSPEQLAETIAATWLADEPSQARRSTAREWVRESFSWEKTGAAFCRVVDSTPPKGWEQRIAFARARWKAFTKRRR